MEKYFLLTDLTYENERIELEKIVRSYTEWSYYGIGRFKIHIGFPDRETIIPIAIKFKNPKTLFKKIEFNMVNANGIVTPHTDHDRFVTMNLPICGNFKNSTVDFYENTTNSPPTHTSSLNHPDGASVEVTTARSYASAELVELVSYEVPICFDTQVIHGVTNSTAEDRYILSLSFKEEFTYQRLKEMYEYGELLV